MALDLAAPRPYNGGTAMDDQIAKYEQEIARLDALYAHLEVLWSRVPRLFVFAVAAPLVWYFVSLGWAIVELLVTFALVGTQAYLIGVRKNENRWNRATLVEDLEKLQAERHSS